MVFYFFKSFCQYKFRGKIKENKPSGIPNSLLLIPVKIYLLYNYKSASAGVSLHQQVELLFNQAVDLIEYIDFNPT